jgi:hypothetical protein
MSNKIVEIQVEPSRVEVGSTFKLKIRAIRYATYEELAQKTYEEVADYTYGELKGE